MVPRLVPVAPGSTTTVSIGIVLGKPSSSLHVDDALSPIVSNPLS